MRYFIFNLCLANCLAFCAPSRSTLFGSGTALPVSISDSFDGGNIELVSSTIASATLKIKPDPFTDLEQTRHSQSFLFRASFPREAAGKTIRFTIENAGQVSYPSAWSGSTVFYTTESMDDATSWKRKLDTEYSKDGCLSWSHECTSQGSVYFAYFPPYSYERQLSLVSASSKYASVYSLGQSIEGREIDCIEAGTGPLQCYVIHRQHPGESMASFYAEGLLNRLLGLDSGGQVDGVVARLLKGFKFHIIPNMCPDGAVAGHLRTNAAGANLNREWASLGDYEAPTLERSPEVLHVLTKMRETGVDCFLDIHGDEELPFNFLSGAEGTVNWGSRLQALHGSFLAAYERANSDMQRKISYEPFESDAPSNIATCAVANEFNCLSATLEMPFKDCQSNPDPEHGWNPHRAKKLGHSLLDALQHVQLHLRSEGPFWETLPLEDHYVVPTAKY